MSGLLALLDDVSAIAKMAASSVDDVAAAATKAGTKAAGVVIDDAAVTPKYVTGLDASRELPIIWRISLGSLRNKLLFLLPVLLALEAFAPWVITPLLMLGGAYLCFEGAEKLLHAVAPHADAKVEADHDPKDPAKLEEERVAGAIKTDFILSAEIMTIALSQIEGSSFWTEAITLAIVGVLITAVVYGAVAIIVKMDDIGLHLAQGGPFAGLGRALVKAMPKLLAVLAVVGTAAMLWVGGNIIVHGLHELGWHMPYEVIHHWAAGAAAAIGAAQGFVTWLVTAACDGVIGVAVGMVLVPLASAVMPLFGKEKAAH